MRKITTIIKAIMSLKIPKRIITNKVPTKRLDLFMDLYLPPFRFYRTKERIKNGGKHSYYLKFP